MDRGHAHVLAQQGVAREVLRNLLGGVPLAQVVHFGKDRAADLPVHVGEVGHHREVEQPQRHAGHRQVDRDGALDARVQHLHRQLATVVRGGPMHLTQAGGRDRRRLEVAEQGRRRRAELGLELCFDLGERVRLHPIAQPGELVGDDLR